MIASACSRSVIRRELHGPNWGSTLYWNARAFHHQGKGIGALKAGAKKGHHLRARGKDVDATIVYGERPQLKARIR